MDRVSQSDAVILYSPVSVGELWAGARPAEHEALHYLFRTLTCAVTDAEVGSQAGDTLRRYRKTRGVELGDALIGAGALLNGAVLWTRNRKHYPMKKLSFF